MYVLQRPQRTGSQGNSTNGGAYSYVPGSANG